MRKLIVAMTAAALVAGGAWAATAGIGTARTPVNCLDEVWQTTGATTSSTTFATVPGLTDSASAIFPIAVNVGLVVSGAPAEFRVLSTNQGDQTHPSKPGVVPFSPSGGNPDAFAFQWIERNQSAAVHSDLLELQWRSVNGSAVNLVRGDMSVGYRTEQGGCTGSI
jgi:hypothetical protein